jgi:hypothetical protein
MDHLLDVDWGTGIGWPECLGKRKRGHPKAKTGADHTRPTAAHKSKQIDQRKTTPVALGLLKNVGGVFLPLSMNALQ